MVDKDEALHMALEALEEPREHIAKHRRLEAITAIKEVLAQPEQESDDLTAAYLSGVYDGKNKYAPQRKPLTDEEIAKAWAQSKGDILMRLKPFARAIEAAHGIKGE